LWRRRRLCGRRCVGVQPASFIHDSGAPERSNTALKFWDEDCNANDVADTCDVDCAGVSGLCAEVIGCGSSSDENGDGVPDECNRPPDCSMDSTRARARARMRQIRLVPRWVAGRARARAAVKALGAGADGNGQREHVRA